MPVEINGSHLIMELDTGATVSIVSETTWSEHLHNPKLEPSSLQLQSYPDRKLQVLGCCIVDTKIQNSYNIQLPLTVVEGQGPKMFGRNWLEKVKLDWTEIAKVNSVTSTTKLERLLEVQRCCMRSVGALQKCKSQALSETRCSLKIPQTSTTSLCHKSQGGKS